MEKQISKVDKEDFRLNKYLAHCGVASRRAADEMIEHGRVQVNGKVVTELGTKINPDEDTVSVDGERIRLPDKHTYILLNKPKDCITTASDEQGRRTVLDLIPLKVRFFPVGRLDRNTTGVLLLTNDGDLAHRLMHPRYRVKKAYVAQLDKPLDEKDRKRLLRGVRVDDKPAKAEEVTIMQNTKRLKVGIVLQEGRNRQVHRMFNVLQYDVKALDRVSYAGLTHTGLQRGEWRHLSKREVDGLHTLVKLN